MNQLTLAVTAYNESQRGNFGWIRECIKPAMTQPLVQELVVTNDATPDYDGLVDAVADASAASPPKSGMLWIRQNPKRLHVFGNKLESVCSSTSEWVLLCDSDNIMPAEYYRRLEKLAPWNPDTWYCASFARPEFDYRGLIGEWKLDDVARMMAIPNAWCFVNTGNQFVHRERFLDIFGKYRGKRFDLEQPNYFELSDEERAMERWFLAYGAADSFFLMKEWLISGGTVNCVPGLGYEHRTETGDQSNYNRAPPEKLAIGPAYYLEMLDAAKGEKHGYVFVRFAGPTLREYRRDDGRLVTVDLRGPVTVSAK